MQCKGPSTLKDVRQSRCSKYLQLIDFNSKGNFGKENSQSGIPEQNIRAISCLYSWPGQPTPSAPANPRQIHMEYLSEADLRQV